ncbi:MAG: hypothetical protein WB680_23205 [Candidatus Acidiferrales bacterium]
MAASPKDEVEKRKADGAHKTRGRQNSPAEAKTTSAFAVTAPQTLGQQERIERKKFQTGVHRKKIHDAREQE